MNVAEVIVLLLKISSLWNRISTDFKTGSFLIPAGGIENCDRIGSQLMQLRRYFVGMEDTSKRMKRSMVHAYIVASTADYIEIFEKIFNAGRVPSKRINLVEFFKTKEYQDK